MSTTTILTYVFGGTAVFCLGMAVVAWLVTGRRKRWPEVMGTVTEIKPYNGGENGPSEVAKVVYRRPSGAEDHLWLGRDQEQLGTQVALRYDPAREDRAVVRGRENDVATGSFGAAFAFGLVAAFCHYLV